MMERLRLLVAFVAGVAIVGLAAVSVAVAQGQAPQPRPRPGLTMQQTKDAVKLAQGAMVELRKKTEGASQPEADRREFVIGVELLDTKEPAPAAEADVAKEAEAPKDADAAKKTEPPTQKPGTPGPRAVVTSYRYFDDITVFSTIDLGTGRVVDVQAAQHMRTPLSDDEFDDSQILAREKSDEVKKLYERFGDRIKVAPQFSQYSVKGDPRVHRVVHLTYRIGKRELSYPRPQVDLTTLTVETPAPEPLPADRDRPRPPR